MGVTLHPPGNPRRFRITRTWKGRVFQVYVPIKGNIAKSRAEADALDAQLAERQRAYRLRLELEGLHVLHEDGRIIGLQRQTRHRDGRKPSDELKIRIGREGEDKPVFKSFSVGMHGYDKAFDMAVEFIAGHRDVEKNSELYRRMLAARQHYLTNDIRHEEPVREAVEDSDELFALLAKEVQAFEEQRKQRAIRG